VAVFTKFDQFRFNIRMELDDKNDDRETDLNTEVEVAFNQRYLDRFTKRPSFVRLESGNFADHLKCTIY
jgi:hypothetical protein